MSRLTAACIQMRSGVDEAKNIAAMEALVRQAAGQGARYVQTPEMTGIVEKDRKRLFSVIETDERHKVFDRAAELAAELGIWLHLGSTAVKLSQDMAANRGALFAPTGARVASYDKIHMFDVAVDEKNTWRESATFGPGSQAIVVDTGAIKLGMAICYDLRFPQLFRHQAKLGAGVLTAPAAFTRPTGEAHWQALIRARAIENGAFFIAAAQGGVHEDGRETFGHSMIAGPWGEIVGMLEHDEPGVLVCDLDLSQIGSARRRIPSLGNDQKFAISLIDATGELEHARRGRSA